MRRGSSRGGRALLAGAALLAAVTGGTGAPRPADAARAAAPAPAASAPFPGSAPAAASSRSDIARLAAANRRAEHEVRRILEDPTAKVGPADRIYYEEPRPGDGADGLPPDQPAAAPAAPFAEAQTFRLHSQPGSPRVIYLDFDGHTIAGTGWNDSAGQPSFYADPYSLDASTSFSSAEHEAIQRVWQLVAEDFSPFGVDVTTEDPGDAAITRSGTSDARFGTRALVTNTMTIASTCSCSGRAYIGAFDEPVYHAYLQPALVFSRSLGGYPKFLAETVSHEVGHNLGLAHDGTSGGAYYDGHGSWAPIMGAGFAKPISQWSKGEYPGATNAEDDLQLIQTAGAPRLPDDHGDTPATATALGSTPSTGAAGVITTDADVDTFRVRAAAGAATFSAVPAAAGPNLDVLLELRSAGGELLARSDPPSTTESFERAAGLDGFLAVTLPADGDYFLSVSGVGSGDAATGYSGYASLGRYTVTGRTRMPAVDLASSLNPSTVHQAVTFTASVSMRAPGSGAPTGTVTFSDGAAALCSAVPLSGGRAACTAVVGAGSRAITATYNGDAAFSAASSPVLSQTVEGDPATVAVTASPSPTVSGQAVTLAATVTGVAPGAPTPAGTVTFRDGSSILCAGVALVGGRGTCSASPGAGSHRFTAVYGGDDWFNAATSPELSHDTGRAATSLDLRSATNPSVSGQAFWLSSTVVIDPPGTAVTPVGGRVTFREGATVLCSGDVDRTSGRASCMPPFGPGSHVVTAEYGGDTERAGATSPPLTQTVTKAEADVSLSATPTPSSAGQNVNLRAVVFAMQPGCCSPTGTVTFTAGGTTLCAAVPIAYGTAHCNRTFPAGDHTLVATYGGEDRFNGGTSPPLTHTVGPPAVTVGLSSSANPAARGVPVTLRASVDPVVYGTGVPTGTMTFRDGASVLCSAIPISSSRASCTVSFGAGSRPLTASYSGDATFAAATSAVLTQVVNGDPATMALTSSPRASVSGETVTFRAVVAPAAPDGAAPSGAVTFRGAAVLCADVALTGGAASCSAALPAGDHPITAAYSGDDRFNAASASLTHAVARAQTTVAVRADENPHPLTRQAALDATVGVTAPGAAAPTGTVTFKNGDTVICASLPVGVSCLPWLGAGTHPITATYSGDGQLAGATSPVHDQVVLPFGDGFTAVTPRRLLDTRTGLGAGAGLVGPGATRSPVVRGGTTGIPSSATAVVLTVTATSASTASYLTAYPAGAARPDVASLTFEPGRTVPNLVPVAVGSGSRISITNAFGSVHVVADVVGYYTRGGGSTSTAITPTRLLDTRSGTGGPAAPIVGGTTRELSVRGGETGIPVTADAVVVNVTVTGPSAVSYLTVHPAGVERPTAASLTFIAGETVSILVVAKIGAGGTISIFNAYGSAHVVADVVAYYAPTGGSTFLPVTSSRILDTRNGLGGSPVALGPGTRRDLKVTGAGTNVPFDASAVVLNVTVVAPSSASYLTVFPYGVPQPGTASLTFGPGQIRGNLVVVGTGRSTGFDRSISLFNAFGTVHVVADIVGYTR